MTTHQQGLMKILNSNKSQHTYRKQVKIKHFTVAMLTIPAANSIVLEGVTVIMTTGILDKDDITVIIIQEMKQSTININGDAKLIFVSARIE